MTTPLLFKSVFRSTFGGPVLALLLLSAAPFAWSANLSKADIEAVYRQDRAACENGNTSQNRQSCLREAGAARAAALKGNLGGTGNKDVWMENALRRCEPHKGIDREMCERMVRGDGAASGSVGGGGVLRELQITVPTDTKPQ